MTLEEKYKRLLEFVAEGCPYRCYYEGNHPSCDSLECDVLREIGEEYPSPQHKKLRRAKVKRLPKKWLLKFGTRIFKKEEYS